MPHLLKQVLPTLVMTVSFVLCRDFHGMHLFILVNLLKLCVLKYSHKEFTMKHAAGMTSSIGYVKSSHNIEQNLINKMT